MKRLFLICVSAFLLSGCALIPKRVELFQKKVKSFPEPSAKLVEVQKAAALKAKEAARATFEDALKENSSPVLRADARDSAVLTDAVSTSLGPPVKASQATSDELANELRAQIAKLQLRIDSFEAQNQKLEGKKIEGTGLLQIPYFAYLAVVILILIIVWHLLHAVVTGLQVAGVANPAVGAVGTVGAAAMSELESLVKKAVSEAKQVAKDVTT